MYYTPSYIKGLSYVRCKLFFFAETFKAKNKIKINKSIGGPFGGWASGWKTPTRRDIDTIIGEIVDLFNDMIPNFNHLETNKYLDDKM